MEKDISWWSKTIRCMNELEEAIKTLRARKKAFLSSLELDENAQVSSLFEEFEKEDFSGRTSIIKFLEGFNSKELHVLKLQIEAFETKKEITKRNILSEIQNMIYGAIIMEANGTMLPESTWGQ